MKQTNKFFSRKRILADNIKTTNKRIEELKDEIKYCYIREELTFLKDKLMKAEYILTKLRKELTN